MDSVREFQAQKGVYYSEKCYKENFRLLKAGKEIPRDQFKTITNQTFSLLSVKMKDPYVKLEYNQKQFFFADNEQFYFVNPLLQKVFPSTKITIRNKKSNEIIKSADKISKSIQYEIEIEKQFCFKNLNDKQEYIKMDYLSTVSDAKKKLSEKFENKIKSDKIKILDENKTEISKENQRLIDIPNYEKIIFYKIADDSNKIDSDSNISKIAKDCYENSNSITNYLVKNNLFYSTKCLQSHMHVHASGKEIKAKDFENCNIVDDSTISIKNDQNCVSIEHNNMKFLFSNDECISDVINLIKKTFKNCINVQILDEKHNELHHDLKISQNEKYSINFDFKFKFKCISMDDHDSNIVLKYFGTVSDAKNFLSNFFCNGDQRKIVIYDDNKDEITDDSIKLIDIPNYKKHIYYEIDTSRGESIKPNQTKEELTKSQRKKIKLTKPSTSSVEDHKEDNKKTSDDKSNISQKEIEKKSIKPNQTKEELNKTQKQKVEAAKPSTSSVEDHKEDNKKTSDDKSDLLTINFVFNSKEFHEELSPETTIEEISKNIKTKYNIKDQIKISYKFGDNFSEIEPSMNIDDVREEINIKGKNYLYIDIKKGSSRPKSISKRLVLRPVKNDDDKKHHKKSYEVKDDDSSEDSEEKPNYSNKKEPKDKKSNDSIIEEKNEEPEDKKSNDSMIEEEEVPEDKMSNDSMIEEEEQPEDKMSNDSMIEEEEEDDDISKFKFKFNKIVKLIPLSINDTLFDSEQTVKEKFEIGEENKIDFFIEDEIIEDKDTIMELLLNKTITIEIRRVDKKKDGGKTYSYKYQTNRDEEVRKTKLDESATVLSMKKEIADLYDVDNLADIKIIFAGKDLLNNIVLKDLNVGDIILYVYIRTTDDILLMTARGLRV